MDIQVSFDQPIMSLPTGFVSAINYVVDYYDNLFTDPITMNISVGYGEILGQAVTGAGESAGSHVGFSSIPNIWDFTPNTKPGWSQYDFAGAVEHEFSEAMGRVFQVPGAQAAYSTTGDPFDWQFNGYDPFNAALDPGEIENRLSNADLDVMQKIGWNIADPFDPNGSEIARLYYGLLDRAPDYAGLDGWKQSGLDIQDVAKAFLASPEYAATNGNPSNGEFVNQLYEAALGRAPEVAGFDAWVGALDHGASRADIAVGIAESPEAVQHNAPLKFLV